MMECMDTRGLSQEKNYHREKESSSERTGNMAVHKMFPSFFPLLYRKSPGTCFLAQSQNSPLNLTLHHTQGSHPAARPAVPGDLGSVLLAWVRVCQLMQGSVEQGGHQQPQPAQPHLGTDTWKRQKHSRKVLTARGFQVPMPGREEHATPFHCPLHLCGSC